MVPPDVALSDLGLERSLRRGTGGTTAAVHSSSERHDARLGDQICESDWVHEGRIQRLQVGLRHPTGDAAGASNMNRNLCLRHLGNELG